MNEIIEELVRKIAELEAKVDHLETVEKNTFSTLVTGTAEVTGVTTCKDTIYAEIILRLKERAAAGADVAAYGQLWVKNTDPNELWFTDGDGTDTKIA